MTKRTAEDLAEEIATCIDSCSLSGSELQDYLINMLYEIAADGDFENMQSERKLSKSMKLLDFLLEKSSRCPKS